jgi:hypothetical protein
MKNNQAGSIAFQISVRRIRSLYLVLFGMDVVLLVGYLALRFGTQGELPWAVVVIRNQLNLTAENVAGVWYSGMILLLIGFAAILCFHLDSEVEVRNRLRKILRPGWLLIAMTFTAFSFDEIASLHERLDIILPQAASGYSGGSSHWVIVLAPIMAVVFLYFFFFFFSHMSQCRWSQVLAVIGTMFLVSVPFQEWVTTTGKGGHFQAFMEEVTEIIGMTLILTAFLEYAIKSARLALRDRSIGSNRRTDAILITVNISALRFFYLFTIVSAVASLLLAWYFVPLLDDVGSRGDPSSWYPSAILFTTALLAFIQRESTAEAKLYSQGWWLVVGTASLLLSLEAVSGLIALIVAQLGKMTGFALTYHAASVFATAVLIVLCLIAAGMPAGLRSATWNTKVVLSSCAVCAVLLLVNSSLATEFIKAFAPTVALFSLLGSLSYLSKHRLALDGETKTAPNLSAMMTKQSS